MHLEVAYQIRGGFGAIYLSYFEEEAEEKLVRGHGLESIFRSVGRCFLDNGFGWSLLNVLSYSCNTSESMESPNTFQALMEEIMSLSLFAYEDFAYLSASDLERARMTLAALETAPELTSSSASLPATAPSALSIAV
jgi:hypothetical protein